MYVRKPSVRVSKITAAFRAAFSLAKAVGVAHSSVRVISETSG